MASKNAYLRKIHKRGNKLRGNAAIISSSTVYNQPNIPNIGAPEDLEITDSGIQRSTQASLAYVSLAWLAPNTGQVNYYIVEYSTDSGFTSYQRQKADIDSAIIEGLKANTLYYFRVQAVSGSRFSDYSNTVSDTTPVDNTAPPDVSNLTATFQNSNLVITWDKPISEIYKDAQIIIKNAAQTITYETAYSGSEQYVWTAERNNGQTANNPLTSAHITVKSRSWNNVLSTGITTTATSTAPSMPVISSSWDSDTGTADEDFVLTWPAIVDADYYGINIDGNLFSTKDNRFTYRYDTNVNNHVPILKSGDPNLVAVVYAGNKLDQKSSNATLSGVNAAPNVSFLSLATDVGFSQIAAHVSLLSNTIIQDFSHYEWALTSGSATLSAFISNTPDVIFPINADGTYSVSVKAVDKFNQKSTALIASGIAIDALTIAELRADAIYSDNLGNSNTTLAILKDTFIVSGITYTTNAWNWTKVERPLIDRYGIITLNLNALATFYIGLSEDDITYTWYAGPLSATGVLTSYSTTQASAESNAVSMASVVDNRVEIPSIKEARYIKLYHKTTASSTIVYEFYPRRLIESDDIRAESIKAINIAAGAITADKISVINLQAVSANMGTLTMDGVISIGASGGIYQGTGTFASPTTGLKLFNSSGVGKLSGYNAGVEQITIGTDGKLKAGAGLVVADEDGLTLRTTTNGSIDYSTAPGSFIKWKTSGGTLAASIWANKGALDNTIELQTESVNTSRTIITALGTNPSTFTIRGGASSSISAITDTFAITGNMSLSGAITTALTVNDTISSSTTDTGTANLATALNMDHLTSNTPAAGFGTAVSFRGHSSTNTLRNQAQIYGDWSVATDGSRQGRLRLNANDSVGARTGLNIIANGSAVQLGFYGATPVSKPTITGAKGGNAALTSLLTALANEGLITDSTT
jgi:hypothetical protein